MARIRTLGLSGFSRDDETVFRELFQAAAVPGWQIGPEADAAALLIDFDSMYGQMAWLRAQGSGRPIAALTVALRADTDFLLQRPASAVSLRELLQQLGAESRAFLLRLLGRFHALDDGVGNRRAVEVLAHPARRLGRG